MKTNEERIAEIRAQIVEVLGQQACCEAEGDIEGAEALEDLLHDLYEDLTYIDDPF